MAMGIFVTFYLLTRHFELWLYSVANHLTHKTGGQFVYADRKTKNAKFCAAFSLFTRELYLSEKRYIEA